MSHHGRARWGTGPGPWRSGDATTPSGSPRPWDPARDTPTARGEDSGLSRHEHPSSSLEWGDAHSRSPSGCAALERVGEAVMEGVARSISLVLFLVLFYLVGTLAVWWNTGA